MIWFFCYKNNSINPFLYFVSIKMDKSVRFSNAWDYVATLELDDFYRFTIDLLNVDLPYGAYTIIVTDDAGNETQTNLIVDDAFVYNVIYHAQ